MTANWRDFLFKDVEEITPGRVARFRELILLAGKPMVRLVPVASMAGPRPLGLLAGQAKESEGWWEADPELEALFYGVDDFDDPASDAGKEP